MLYETGRLLRHVTYWLLARRPTLSLDGAVRELRSAVRDLTAHLAEALSGQWRSGYDAVLARYTGAGVPPGLARRMALLDAQNSALDLVELAAVAKAPVADTAQVYFGLGARLGLDWIHAQVNALQTDGNWQAVARAGLRDSVYQSHRLLTQRVFASTRRTGPASRIDSWVSANAPDLAQWERMQADMRAAGAADFATLSVGAESLRRLTP